MTISPIRETQIQNGPLLITHAMPEVQTVSAGIFLDVGSRDECDAQAGMAHALEHMLFKGTREHDVHELSELLDELGGTANAFTARERTCFHMRVLREDWQKAVSVLCSMVLTPTLPEDEWQREREVIFSEMAMAEDVPEDWVFDRHVEALFPGQAMGRPILGTRATLSNFGKNELGTFLESRYRPPRMLIAAAGCVTHAVLLEYLNACNWPRASVAVERETPHMNTGVQKLERDDEQAHIVCSFPGIDSASDERPVAWLANQMLGGGMSSQLFREVRERRGLAYGIGSHLSSLSDTGTWTISASTDPGRLGECTRVIRDVLGSFCEALNPSGLRRAKRQLEVSMRMGMDSTDANMLHLGARFDEESIQPQDEWVECVQQVDLKTLRAWVSAHLGVPALWSFSGPDKALRNLPKDLQA
ncbi:MAG: pitrilysin family protein [Mariprofundaceae bacterium]|nr:pitrilysin family protein [Mariprofundaceae bacterium]